MTAPVLYVRNVYVDGFLKKMLRLNTYTLHAIATYLSPFDIYMWRLTCHQLHLALQKPAKAFHVREAVTSVKRFLFARSLPNFPRENSTYCLEMAARAGNLPVIEWFAGQNLHSPQMVLDLAANFAHRHVILWLRRNYACLIFNSSLAQLAAASGDVETVYLLRTYGLRWNVLTTITAAQHMNNGMLRWLIAHGCPWDVTICIRDGVRYANIVMLEWLLAQGYCTATGFPHSAGIAAVWTGRVTMLQWLASKGCIRDYHDCLVLAIFCSNLNQVQWLLLHAPCTWRAEYIELAVSATSENSEMVSWMRATFA